MGYAKHVSGRVGIEGAIATPHRCKKCGLTPNSVFHEVLHGEEGACEIAHSPHQVLLCVLPGNMKQEPSRSPQNMMTQRRCAWSIGLNIRRSDRGSDQGRWCARGRCGLPQGGKSLQGVRRLGEPHTGRGQPYDRTMEQAVTWADITDNIVVKEVAAPVDDDS